MSFNSIMLVQKKASLLISFVVLFVMAWLGARLMWQIISPLEISVMKEETNVTQSSHLPSIMLFGRKIGDADAVAKTAAEASLIKDWQMLGSVIDGSYAMALIQMGSTELRWLKKGEALENGLQVIEILPNEIQFLTAQGVRSLVLFAKAFTQEASVGSVVSSPLKATASLHSLRDQLQANPMKATQVMRMEPVWLNGQLHGLKLAPLAGQEAVFNQLGLQPGDELTSLNGESLGYWMNKMGDLPKVLQGASARIRVLRHGSEREWIVNW